MSRISGPFHHTPPEACRRDWREPDEGKKGGGRKGEHVALFEEELQALGKNV